jgi:hypothetical protein
MSGLRIVLANGALAGYPQGGGIWSLFLQYPLGLAGLGHDVYWLELFESSGDSARDQNLITGFFDRFERFGLSGRCCLLEYPRVPRPIQTLPDLGSMRIHGMSEQRYREIAGSADMLWNFACFLRQPLLSLFRHRVLIDGDPGFLQVSALTRNLAIHDHHRFLTVGLKVHDRDCQVPSLGVTWRSFPQFVHLPMWKTTPDPGGEAAFTSVVHWNWGEVWWNERVLSISKREAYLRYADLPLRTNRSFELAADIRPGHKSGDRELLESKGWGIVHPWDVACSPEAYQDYIASSRAQFECPKPVYRELKTGWFSDRSACYLASGRPVLAEDTGFCEHLPTGHGLLAFRDLAEAIAGVAEIDGNYEHHSKAARRLAEEFLDAGRCLNAMLSACQ